MNKILTLIALLLSLCLSSSAAPTCPGIYSDTQKLKPGDLLPDFKHNSKYSNEIRKLGKVQNQCYLDTCYLYAWVSHIEASIQAKTGKKITLSTEYLSLSHWVVKSLDLLKSDSIEIKEIDLESPSYAFQSSILRFGLLPAELWTAGNTFQREGSAVLMEYVRNIIVRTKTMNSKEVDSKKRKENLAKAKNNIINIFLEYVGPLGEKFWFYGETFTPQEFQKRYFPELSDPLYVMMPKENTNTVQFQGNHSRFGVYGVSLDIIENTIKQLIDKGKTVQLSYGQNNAFMDKKTGIMSTSAFNTPEGAEPLPREQRNHYSLNNGGHTVQIVGYDLDPVTKKIIKFKIQNSWGTDIGDKGFFHMYRDYFRTYMTSIYFLKENTLVLPKETETLPVQGDLFSD